MYTFKSHRSALLTILQKMEKLDDSFGADPSACPSGAEELPISALSPDSAPYQTFLSPPPVLEAEDPIAAEAKRAYPKKSMKWWWAGTNLRSLDGLPALGVAHLSDEVPRMGEKARMALKAPGAAPEPPSDGTVVILGHHMPKAGVVERVLANLTPASREEILRLVLACSLGAAVAAVYVKVMAWARVC